MMNDEEYSNLEDRYFLKFGEDIPIDFSYRSSMRDKWFTDLVEEAIASGDPEIIKADKIKDLADY